MATTFQHYEGNRAKVLTRERETRNKLLRFLRMNHIHCFHPDYLHSYLDIPLRDVIDLCDSFVAQGWATQPEYTSYYQGVKIDWALERASMTELFDWPQDPLEVLLAEAYAAQQRLNASRDTSAVQASNANTRKLLDALKGNLL